MADSIYLTLTVSGIGNVDIGYEYSYTLPAFTEAVGGTVSVNVPEYYENVNAAASYYFNIERQIIFRARECLRVKKSV